MLQSVDCYSSQLSMKTLYIESNIGNMGNQDFEFLILESALENVVNKFRYKSALHELWMLNNPNNIIRRHLRIKKPALEMLLQQIEQCPETTGLKRLLAVKKSLLEFEQRVEQVVRVVQQLLSDNEVKVKTVSISKRILTITCYHKTGYFVFLSKYFVLTLNTMTRI